MKKIIITFVALIIGLICRAQTIDEHYYFKSLSSQNGLSQNTVSAILQDSKGFMWFGTKDGLDRYDGVSFRHFKYDRTNPRSLGNNFVTSLYEDVEGNIWVGTDVGVYIYYPEKDTFRHFVELSDKNTRIERAVAMISGDKQGRIWIASEAQNLFCYDLKEQSLRNYILTEHSLVSTNVKCLTVDNSGTIWIGFYGDGLFYSKDNLKTLHPYLSPVDNEETYNDDVVSKIVSGAYNCLYISSLKGMCPTLKAIDKAVSTKITSIALNEQTNHKLQALGLLTTLAPISATEKQSGMEPMTSVNFYSGTDIEAICYDKLKSARRYLIQARSLASNDIERGKCDYLIAMIDRVI